MSNAELNELKQKYVAAGAEAPPPPLRTAPKTLRSGTPTATASSTSRAVSAS